MHRSICSQILCLKWFKSAPEEVFTPDNKVSIMDMPDLVMRKILGNVGFTTIMKLRKVCHAFRNFIDDSKLDYELTQVAFFVSSSLIRVVFIRSSADRIILNYAKYATSSLVKVNGLDRLTYLKDEDFLDVFSRDLRVILRNQRVSSMKLVIKEYGFETAGSLLYNEFLNRNFTTISNKNNGWWCCCRNEFKSRWEFVDHLREINGEPLLKPSLDQFYDCFKTVLKSRGSTPIRIEELDSNRRTLHSNRRTGIQELYIEVMESYHFMDIARFIDIKHMKCLDINRVYRYEDQFLDEIVELDGWECIQKLAIRNFKITIPLERFLHKSQFRIWIPTISMEDVLFLKMRVLISPVSQYYIIYYDNLKDNMDRLISVLGSFEIDAVQRKHWYFRIPDTKQVLDICHDHCSGYGYFSFLRSEISDVPKNAIIY